MAITSLPRRLRLRFRQTCRFGLELWPRPGVRCAIDQERGAVDRVAHVVETREDVGVGDVLIGVAEERLRRRLRRHRFDARRARLPQIMETWPLLVFVRWLPRLENRRVEARADILDRLPTATDENPISRCSR